MSYTLPARGSSKWDEDLQEIFNAIDEDISAAGTGTAKMRIGTRAERKAYASPYDGLYWVETDYHAGWKYEGSLSDWVQIAGDNTHTVLTAEFYG
jgi:hypothetical protein